MFLPLPEEFMTLISSLEQVGDTFGVPVFVTFRPSTHSPQRLRYLHKLSTVVRLPWLWLVQFSTNRPMCVVVVDANFGCPDWKRGKVLVVCTKLPKVLPYVWDAVRRWAAYEDVRDVSCFSYNNQTRQVLPAGFE